MTWKVCKTAPSRWNRSCTIFLLPFSPFRVSWTPQELLHLSLAGVGCERMLETRRFWVGWSWTVGAERRQSGSWRAELAWSPGKSRLGLRQVPWQQPDLWRSKTGAREWEQLRRKTASEKTASQMENTFREQEAADEMGSHLNGKEVKPREKWDIHPKLRQSLLFFPFEVAVGILRWICYPNSVKVLLLSWATR